MKKLLHSALCCGFVFGLQAGIGEGLSEIGHGIGDVARGTVHGAVDVAEGAVHGAVDVAEAPFKGGEARTHTVVHKNEPVVEEFTEEEFIEPKNSSHMTNSVFEEAEEEFPYGNGDYPAADFPETE
ncbi:MAG: hypothetical protein WC707_06620 [Candidatus Babeliaceae bacterium]|jgi:hypothetical protein